MNHVLVALWLTFAGAVMWRWRPTPCRRPGSGENDPPSQARGRLSLHDVWGREPVATTLRVVPRWLDPVSFRTVLLVTATSLAAVPVTGVLAPVGGVATLIALRSRGRRERLVRCEQSLADVAVLVELLGVAVMSGLSPSAALITVGGQFRRGHDSGLARLVADLERGRSLVDAVADWSRDGPTRELAALLRSADDGGVAVVDALERLARDLRRRRRRSAEQRARRLPVTMLLPLVTCVLPAFGLLTVVPMVAVGLGRLGSLP